MPDDNRNLTPVQPPQPPAMLTGFNLMGLIERALSDPGFPAETIKGLFEMAEKAQRRADVAAFNTAIANIQRNISPVLRTKMNPSARSLYAPYEEIMEMLQPLLDREGVRVSFGEVPGAPEGKIRMTMTISLGAYSETREKDISSEFVGARGNAIAMTKQQMSGGAQTYAMRYMVIAYFNITLVNPQDDDGEGGREAAPQRQAQEPRQQAAPRGEMAQGQAQAAPAAPPKWKAKLEGELAAQATVADLHAFITRDSFIVWRAKASPANEAEIVAMIIARRAAIEAAPPADEMADPPDDASPAPLSDPARLLLARIELCQTKVALDSLMDAAEFTLPLSKLPLAEGERVNKAYQERAALFGDPA
jgi:hypothetical protein